MDLECGFLAIYKKIVNVALDITQKITVNFIFGWFIFENKNIELWTLTIETFP